MPDVEQPRQSNIDVLVRLIRHGIEALRDGDGDAITARATLENLDRLVEELQREGP